jgi:hypothetical protein
MASFWKYATIRPVKHLFYNGFDQVAVCGTGMIGETRPQWHSDIEGLKSRVRCKNCERTWKNQNAS